MKPLINVPSSVEITTEEKSLVLSIDDDDLFNAIVDLDDRFNGVLMAFQKLNEVIENFKDGLPAEFQGDVATISVSEEEYPYVRPKMVAVNTLAVQIREMVSSFYSDAENVMDNLSVALREKLGIKQRLTKTLS